MEKNRLAIGTMDKSRTQAIARRRSVSQKPSAAKSADAVRLLQNMGGNRAVQGLFESGAVQAKLTIGPVNDIYEQGADQVADQVMRMADTSVNAIQRKPG